MADFYFDEIINVVKIDSQVVYDKVSRINAKSEDNGYYLELDVHTELYPMLPSQKYRMLISNTLHMDGSAVAGYFSEGEPKSLADKFEYVMHGLLYKMAESQEKTDGNDDVKVEMYISFGGLQLMLKGDPLKMHKFKVDQKLFLLLREDLITIERHDIVLLEQVLNCRKAQGMMRSAVWKIDWDLCL